MASKFPDMRNHVIVCGYGTVGAKVVDVLVESNVPFIVIDADPKKVERVKELGYKVIEGDATLSRVLKDAAIDAAKAIAVIMDNDAKNLFGVLTARDISKNIFIATRANDEFVREKLVEAGADYIVMPQKVASKEIIKELFKE
ncbi:MAG: NAD-binding protein [Candidatus Micrarchaeales archaeon]|nr:NAD-binding protein [Candidatus Micrarchaeales archaeon]